MDIRWSRTSGHAEFAARTAHIDDDPALPHMRRGFLGQNRAGDQIHIQRLMPQLPAGGQTFVPIGTGIVHHNVDTPGLCQGRLHAGIQLRIVTNIGGHELGLAHGLQTRLGTLAFFLAATHNQHPRTGGTQSQGDIRPQPLCGPGHDGDLTL